MIYYWIVTEVTFFYIFCLQSLIVITMYFMYQDHDVEERNKYTPIPSEENELVT